MKATFFLALFLGFAGVLAAGHFVPWGAHVRLPSQTHVIANGGRDGTVPDSSAGRSDRRRGSQDGRTPRRGAAGREHAATAAHGRAAARRAFQDSRRGRQRDRSRGAALERGRAHVGHRLVVDDPEPRRAALDRARASSVRRSTRRCAAPATTPAQPGPATSVSRSRPKAPTTRSWQPAATSSRVSPASTARLGRSPASLTAASCTARSRSVP